jgi:major membrane immunogen (membrane-anchored lipoprotein)
MTIRRFAICALFVLVAVGAAAFAAGVAGKWTAAIDTQIGVQNYTYDFQVDGEKLTGTAKSQFSESQIVEGSVKGDDISFVENLKYEDQVLRVVYKGKIAGDEIKFNRQVGEVASEDFVAKRAK